MKRFTHADRHTSRAPGGACAFLVVAGLVVAGDGCAQNVAPDLTASQQKELPSTSAQTATAARPTIVSRINVSFKLDPQLSGATYGGERWLSPSTFTSSIQQGNEATVEARVEPVDAKGQPVTTNPSWTAADPAMVVVSPISPGVTSHVLITVKHAGESKLTVVADGFSHEMLIKARSLGNGRGLQVAISQ